VLVAAFEGWNDAGDAASGAVEHLEGVWDAEQVAAIDPDEYYDFQVNRPTVSLVDGHTRRITWPTTRVSVCRLGRGRPGRRPGPRPGAEHALARLLRGAAGVAAQLEVELVVTLGALLADSPHTRPVPVSGTASDREAMRALGLERSRYEGPTGIVGVFQDVCTSGGLPAVSFWAAVPHYVASPPCPKATLALLRRIEDLLDLPVPLEDLPERARAWEHSVDELAAGDSDVAEYIASLEQREAEVDLPEASGEAIAKEFERYLKRGGDDEG
jgi:hypothetical protein